MAHRYHVYVDDVGGLPRTFYVSTDKEVEEIVKKYNFLPPDKISIYVLEESNG